ncbi:TadE family type IV pilus minor pilin [Nocardia higoensis]|uniref:TadE family type IV pilus minor pilin n=1 Tax=Nocardia higoensis TaxID=228599 RepID=UPI00157558BC|nr:TadE family type IV pilus minor pilin [Nocardia higoensis]
MTVEAAIAVAAIMIVVMLCLGAVLAASAQVRCVDAAREAARLEARGDTAVARAAAGRVAPPGADISVRREGAFIVAVVSARTPLLPLRLRAEAVAVREPGTEAPDGQGR